MEPNMCVPRVSRSQLLQQRQASVSLMFATMAIPLVLSAGLAVDYSFYVEAQSQLSVAADAASLHAVRVASAEFLGGTPLQTALNDGTTAAQQWWAAQLGTIADANIPATGVTTPEVTYNATTGTFSETVTYSGSVPTHLATVLTKIGSWPIGGTSTASIAASAYSEFMFLVDNSSSMLIGASPTDIINLEQATVCAPTVVASAFGRNVQTEYAWNFPTNIGYGAGQTVPTSASVKGSCYSNFTGSAAQCPYPESMPGVDSAGFCPTGTGVPDPNLRIDPNTRQIANIPNAPCAFACHQAATNDYYALARASKTPISLRFDVIQQAMANVVATLQSSQKITNQFLMGVFQFNSTISQVHPAPGTSCVDNGQGNCQGGQNGRDGKGGTLNEADNNLAQAATDIQNIQSPIVPDVPNTDFPDSVQYLAGAVSPGGDGSSPSARIKNLFIITDGMEDFQPAGGARSIGPMTSVSPEPYCSQMKALGYNIYVLYTPYYPLPNPFYLNSGPRTYVEPTVPPATTNPVIAALQACATTPAQFYQAQDTASINSALQLMVQSAIATPAGFTN